jgi:hypothetical protein
MKDKVVIGIVLGFLFLAMPLIATWYSDQHKAPQPQTWSEPQYDGQPYFETDSGEKIYHDQPSDSCVSDRFGSVEKC